MIPVGTGDAAARATPRLRTEAMTYAYDTEEGSAHPLRLRLIPGIRMGSTDGSPCRGQACASTLPDFVDVIPRVLVAKGAFSVRVRVLGRRGVTRFLGPYLQLLLPSPRDAYALHHSELARTSPSVSEIRRVRRAEVIRDHWGLRARTIKL